VKYEVHGPFDVPRVPAGTLISRAEVRKKGSFWTDIGDRYYGLPRAKGIYIFGLRTGGGLTPYYVGKTGAIGGFWSEVFNSRNLYNYSHTINANKGTPIIFLLAKPRASGRGFMRPRKRELEFLEKMIISKAWEKNNELINVHHVRHLRELVVPGLLGDYGRGTLTKEEQALRQLLGA